MLYYEERGIEMITLHRKKRLKRRTKTERSGGVTAVDGKSNVCLPGCKTSSHKSWSYQMSRKHAFLAICTLLMFLFLSANPALASKEDGILRIGWNQEPRTLNPMGPDTVQAGTIMCNLLYDTLVTRDEGMNPAPMLAKSWEVSEDGLVWTFHLIAGAKWHDGNPLTSADIAFTYRYVKDHKIGNYINFLKHIQSIDVPNPTTLVLTYREPIATTLNDLASVYIVAKHKWERIKGEAVKAYENKTPLGSGPFIFEEWRKNDYISFKANAGYWRKKPQLKRVIFTYFASRDPMIMSLQQGDIDVIATELTPLSTRVLAKDKNLKVVKTPNLYYRHICINSSTFGQGHPALRDARVRRALSMTVDKKRLVGLIHLGFARPGLSVVMDGTPFYYNDQIQRYGFDPQGAEKLLDEAGWRDSDEDGVRDKDGLPLEITLLVISRWPEEMRAAEMIRDWWQGIGVKLSLQSTDAGTILAEIFPDYRHDMYLWGFTGQPDPNFSTVIYLSDQRGKWNGAGYQNPEYDALFEEQIRSVDPERRRELIYKMQEIHYRDSPSIVLYYMSAIGAYRSDRLTGFKENVAGGLISQLYPNGLIDVHFK
jgi:peptide/nickel transport system substrate-binding protein